MKLSQLVAAALLPACAFACSSPDAGKATGGDVPRADTHISAAKTLGVALGIDAAALDASFNDNGSIKHVKASVVA